MGNPEIAAGPSSQHLTGGNKKFSSKLGDDYDFETQKGRCGMNKYGCCGMPWRDVRLFLFALGCLYAFLALLYLGLLTAAMEVRQEEWLELQNDFFGPFSKVERRVYNSSNQWVPVRKLTISQFEALSDADQQIFHRTFNRADGCDEVQEADGGTYLECDKKNDEDGRWVLFPWVTDNLQRLDDEFDLPGCFLGISNPAAFRERTWTTLEVDGKYGSPESTPGNAILGPHTCMSYMPIRPRT